MANIGIVGLGFMGQTHFRNYAHIPGANVVAFCDIDPKRAAGDFSGTWGNVETASAAARPAHIRGVADYRELLKQADIDIIDICVPTPSHVDIALAALSAGKHVLCEKPLAVSLDQGRKVAAAASEAAGYFMPAMCIRFWPAWAWAKRAVASGEFGKVRSATFTRLASPPPGWYQNGDKSGGAILDLHVHDTDFVNYLFGPPQKVFSRGYSKTSGRIDHLITHYLFGEEPLVVAEGGWTMEPAFGFRMRYTISFDRATADYDLGRKDSLLLSQGGEAAAVSLAETDGWHEELKYFVDCVEQRRRPSLVTADDAVRALAVIEAERESIRCGSAVKV